jgi:hypothetical protein
MAGIDGIEKMLDQPKYLVWAVNLLTGSIHTDPIFVANPERRK